MTRIWYDMADPNVRGTWLHHPELGDMSFDSFVRLPANPIYTGKAPYEWPVNGFLLRDPVSRNLYVYIGAYARGYWGEASYCHLLRSRDDGATWDDLGPVLRGSTDLFDSCDGVRGSTPDVSVVYADGIYHMIYDWARHTTDLAKKDGGFAYAWSSSPEGPFERAPEPCFAQSNQPLVFGLYRMVYASALIRRANDWLVISDMSTLNNAGGTWALVAFTSRHPAGPYSGPHFLLWPQTSVYYPTTVESFPAFAHDSYVYAPNTSVARNRTYQILYRAPIEQAHLAEAWEVVENGSIWHAEATDNEARGIWGQTLAAEVEADGTMWAMFPCLNSAERGTINIARRPWAHPFRHGGVLSAPNGPAVSLLLRDYTVFNLQATLRVSGPTRLVWQHNAPFGPDCPMGAEGGPHPLTMADCCELWLGADGWALKRIDAAATSRVIAHGDEPRGFQDQRNTIEMQQMSDTLRITLNGTVLWEGLWLARPGCIGLFAETGSRVWLDEFRLDSAGEAARRFLLPTEGVMGYGLLGDTWQRADDPDFRYGTGYTSACKGAGCKWCWHGGGFTWWSPLAPEYGQVELQLDGKLLATVDLSAGPAPSAPRLTLELPRGHHALAVINKSGILPCDVLQVAL